MPWCNKCSSDLLPPPLIEGVTPFPDTERSKDVEETNNNLQIYIYDTSLYLLSQHCVLFWHFLLPLFTTCFGPPGHHQVSHKHQVFIFQDDGPGGRNMLWREGVRSVKIKHSVAIAGIDLCHIYIYIYTFVIHTQQDATHRNNDNLLYWTGRLYSVRQW
jgi:hypothetical protein